MSLFGEYRKHEAANEHAENAVLLAKHFGTEEELAEAKRRLEDRNARGYSTEEDEHFQYQISHKYWPHGKWE